MKYIKYAMLRKARAFNLLAVKYLDRYHRLASTKTSGLLLKVQKKKNLTITEKEVYKFFSTPDRKVAQNFPVAFFTKKRGKSPDNFYIAHKSAANSIFKAMKKDLPADKLIMEVNPGIGLLTQKFIDETNNELFLYESHEELFDKLAVSNSF